ncbi:ANTAR domain-containing response regulator [Vibrio mangrovi]|uniref:ANTAR domain-containing protein n=1 Tax=Vibrio mangrovi TaxID=474394 RepID=A0A1Y6IS21_9VIBR|nr:ANTAR domain-containing protein [Vibrio mangrovi]MDW6004338.1 ANTAR domain-containing protein [Vibrio mangrovi]SMR98863.1 putative transcriptional regulatory protein pdtaR [Vibrio mangrovi]
MTISQASQTIICCCDQLRDQDVVRNRLAVDFSRIVTCSLPQIDHMLMQENHGAVVVSWQQPTAELRLMVEICFARRIPLLILLKQFSSIDINRLPSINNFVMLPFHGEERLKPWIEYAQKVQDKAHQMCGEIDKLQLKIEERKWVERAKGLLMKVHRMDENEAYKAMRHSSMKTSQPMYQIAKNIIHTFELNHE